MSRRRGLARLVDPWAALLLGVLVALGVVILLATPGPWHDVVGPAPVRLTKPLPRDIALYVRAAAPLGRCTTVAWVHVEYEPASLTVVLVPPQTEVPVEAGGFAPVGRLVSDAGAGTATAGLAQALDTPLGGWLVVGRDTLRVVLAAARSPGSDRLGMLAFRQAMTAMRAAPVSVISLSAQQRVMARVLQAVPYGQLNQAALVNYVLGSTEVDTDLDLRVASAVVRAVRAMKARDVAVRTLPTIVEHCGTATRWRTDTARAERLRLSLVYGLAPPGTRPSVAGRECLAEIVVTAPGGDEAERFVAALERRLRTQAAGPVAVRLELLGQHGAVSNALSELPGRQRPLAVVVAPWLTGAGTTSSPSGLDNEELGALLTRLATVGQPVVVLAPSSDVVPQPSGGIAPAPLVLSPVTDAFGEAPVTPETLAGLSADAVMRSCWPAYLAPRLTATRLGFSYAARRATTVALLSGDAAADLRLAARLGASGWDLRPMTPDAWQAPTAGSLIAFMPGEARAAEALKGDVEGLLPALPRRRAAIPDFPVEDAPEPVALVFDG